MALIGIICDSKDEKYFKKTLEKNLNSNNKTNTIIIINQKSIENIQNVQFETILINSNNEEVLSKKNIINKVLSASKYLILNGDLKINIDEINNVNLSVITYGFNSKSTVTASSVEDDIFICLQRKIIDINDNIIDEQEIKICRNEENNKIELVMAITTIMLIHSTEDIKTRNNLQFM